MLPALNFAARAISRSGLAPVHSCFRIAHGRVTGFDGILAMSAPLNLSFDAAPAAVPFTKAIAACEGPLTIVQDSPTKITVKAGGFRASVPCLGIDKIPTVRPEGNFVALSGVLDAFRALKPFISTDERTDRAWCRGVLLSGASAMATNNVCLVEHWLGSVNFPKINVPVDMVDEMIRTKDEPTKFQISPTSITAHYNDGRWIRSQLCDLTWPDLGKVMSEAWEKATLTTIDPALKEACAKLGKFAAVLTYFRGQDVATERQEAKDGIAAVSVVSPATGCYHTRHLLEMLKAADTADFGAYPRPVPFIGGMMRGVICGVRE